MSVIVARLPRQQIRQKIPPLTASPCKARKELPIEGEIKVGLGNIVDVILDGCRACLQDGGLPFVLQEKQMAAQDRARLPRCSGGFLEGNGHASRLPHDHAYGCAKGDCPLTACAAPALPGRSPHSRRRKPGTLRYVALFDWRRDQIALEARAATPSACLWARPAASSRIYYQLAVEQAIRCPDPFVRLSGRWLARQLVLDSSPIDIETMSGQKDQDRLLHAMAWEAVNVHLGTPRAAVRLASDLTNRSAKWLRTAVKDMAAATLSDWQQWKKSRPI